MIMKEKSISLWQKLKNFYKRNYEKNKVLTIILTIIATPILLVVLFYVGVFVIVIGFTILVLWHMIKITFGSNAKSSSANYSNKKPSGKTYYGYSEEEIIAIIEASPKLNMYTYDWYNLAEALDISKYNKELKIIYAGKLPIYIFPYDKKPKMNIHFLKESTIESGGNLFEKAKEHFTTSELNNGDICIIYDGKRLTSKDL